VDSGFAIWDQFKACKCPIRTVVSGMAASMGSVLSLVSGKGHRYAFPNARIMMHQPLISGWVQGQASDLEITATEIEKTKAKLVRLYVEATGKEQELIENTLDRDYWMSSEDALNFGLLDKVIHSYDEIK
jgi:ATP-dependent Clp protease protease subunit